ncbi:type II toxin-antitoxin system Phd/YefM family antitoxin [Candidatus Contubernalis alkaliaceticus]|uniref:type II toxin-antitoxin system Phd/YefM family antitoxin n=1 Tax=Candidatus Contubernalis alkaliaceticus TaxID=338645 RepID=UPI001F4BCF97|nr:type II toxin-antitoxin system Phd/YefM family antitoxin [Candidatus Contubernalis alkalaceticus]UNC92106.1 type II toxin-antitoxin system Phd/YefM family antitoxin [Candidatus Contubernalis alkalaceticus]
MRMVSITEIRRNAKAVLAELVKNKKPIAILQRSKPVAYIIDAESFDKLQLLEDNDLKESRKRFLEKITKVKKRIVKKGVPEDSIMLIRDLREGKNRYE